MSERKLIVGLGNPGPKYEGTRHNVGFDVVDRLAQGGGPGAAFARKFDGLLAEAEIDFRRVLLLKPQTFMNLSGRSVRQAVQFYKLDPAADLLVICDDISLPLGKLRLRPGGGPGGHRGMESVIAALRTEEVPRLRLGIAPAAGVSNARDGRAGSRRRVRRDQFCQTTLRPFVRLKVATVQNDGFALRYQPW